MRRFIVSLVFALVAATPALAADGAIELRLRDHKFEPSEIHVAAEKPFVLHLINEDDTPEEFDSTMLGVEKVVPGSDDGLIRVTPLPAGLYQFMGEFHPNTAQGRVIVE